MASFAPGSEPDPEPVCTPLALPTLPSSAFGQRCDIVDAVTSKDVPTLRALLTGHSLDPTSVYQAISSFLCEKGDLEITRTLVEMVPLDMAQVGDGMLYAAARSGDRAQISYLLSVGASRARAAERYQESIAKFVAKSDITSIGVQRLFAARDLLLSTR